MEPVSTFTDSTNVATVAGDQFITAAARDDGTRAALDAVNRLRSLPRATPVIPVRGAPPGLQHMRFLKISDEMQANFKRVMSPISMP